MNKLLLLLTIIFAFTFAVNAQTTEPEQPTVTITQETADKLFDLGQKGRLFDVYKNKAEADIKERDKIIEDLKIKLAVETQRGSDGDAEKARLTAILMQMIPNLKKKCAGLCIFNF